MLSKTENVWMTVTTLPEQYTHKVRSLIESKE